MATHCQTAAQSRNSGHQNIGAVNSLQGKKRGLSTSNYEPIKGSYLQNAFFLTLFCEMHDIHYIKCFIEKFVSLLYTILP